jgi:hypothetical protein
MMYDFWNVTFVHTDGDISDLPHVTNLTICIVESLTPAHIETIIKRFCKLNSRCFVEVHTLKYLGKA